MSFLLTTTATASAYVNTNLLAGSLGRLNPRSQEQGCCSGQLHTHADIVMGTVSSSGNTQLTRESPLLLGKHRLCFFSL